MNPFKRRSLRRRLPTAVGLLFLAAIVGWANSYRRMILCQANLKGIAMALHVYENDFDQLPAADSWCDEIIRVASASGESFCCPSTNSDPGVCDYVLNAAVYEFPEETTADTILVFEGVSGWNRTGGPQDARFRHQGKCGVAYASGGLDMLNKTQLTRAFARNQVLTTANPDPPVHRGDE